MDEENDSLALNSIYQSFFDNTPDGLSYGQVLFDSRGQATDLVYLKVNKNFEKMTGLKGVGGQRVTMLIPGISTTNPELLEIFGRVALGGKPEKFETRIEFLAKWFSVSVYSPAKEFFIAVFQNITDRKSVEQDLENAKIAACNVLEDLQAEKEALANAKAKDDALLESLGEGLIAVDNNGRIMMTNRVATEMLGWKMSDLIGKVVTNLTLEDESGQVVPLAARPTTIALTTGELTRVTYFFVRPDKTRFPIAITATPVKLNGEIIGLIEILRDVTHEREIDKAKSEFVSLASHQLRTPTTAIGWYSEMLLSGEIGPLNVKQKKYLKEIHHGNQRMIDLVNALLSVSRIELGTFAIYPELVNVATIAEDVLVELQTQINEKKLKIDRRYDREIPMIENDQKMIRIVLQNLLSNAVIYTPSQGQISVTIKKNSAAVWVEVEDDGCGIPADAQAKIYTKFFRADNARAVRSDGTGLGLYITKSTVEALGGEIKFKSKVGEGTTFSVSFIDRKLINK